MTEIVIAVGILGLVVAGTAAAMSGLFKSQAMLVDRNEANEFAATLNDYFQSDKSCSGGLMGAPFPQGNTTGVNFTIPNFNKVGISVSASSNTPQLLGAGSMITERLRVSRIVLRDKGVAPVIVDNDPATGPIRQYVAQVVVSMENRSDNQWLKLKPRDFEFPVLVGPSGSIVACRISGELKEACDLIGGRYNPTTGVCTPETQCQVNGAYSTSVCQPALSCPAGSVNPITNNFSCPSGSVQTQTGYFEQTFNVYCGKKCSQAVLNMVTFYLCMKCS